METNWEQVDTFIEENFNEGDMFKCIIGGLLGVYHKDNLIHDDDGDVCVSDHKDHLVYIYVNEGELAEKHIFVDPVGYGTETTKITDKKNIQNWLKNKKRSETINKVLSRD